MYSAVPSGGHPSLMCSVGSELCVVVFVVIINFIIIIIIIICRRCFCMIPALVSL